MSSMADSKAITHASAIFPLLQVTPTGSVLAHLEDTSTRLSSIMLRTHIPVTELVFSALRLDLTPCLEPSHRQNPLKQLPVKPILSHSFKLALSAAPKAKLLLS